MEARTCRKLFLGLRTRVVAARLSCLSFQLTAIRFEVSASSAIRSRAMERLQGHRDPEGGWGATGV
jgi:hypothetical protein